MEMDHSASQHNGYSHVPVSSFCLLTQNHRSTIRSVYLYETGPFLLMSFDHLCTENFSEFHPDAIYLASHPALNSN